MLERTKAGFNESTLEIGLQLTPSKGADGSPEEREFALIAPAFGLTEEDYQRTFVHVGKVFSLVAFKPRNRKYPVIGINHEGQRYKFPLSVLDSLD